MSIQIVVELIPVGSHELRIFEDGHDVDKDDIDTVMVLHHIGPLKCEAALAKGHLTEEINFRIGIEAHKLGYKYLYFHAVKDKKVTHYAEYLYEDTNHKYYKVDLDKHLSGVKYD